MNSLRVSVHSNSTRPQAVSSTKNYLKPGLGIAFDDHQPPPYNDVLISKFKQNPISFREEIIKGHSGGLLLNQLDHLNAQKNQYNLRLGPLRIVSHLRRDSHQTLVESHTELEFKQRTSRQIDFAKKQEKLLKNEISAKIDETKAAKSQTTLKEPRAAPVGTERLQLVTVASKVTVTKAVHLLVLSQADQSPIVATKQLVACLVSLTDVYLSQLTYNCFMARCPSLNLFKKDTPADIEGAAPGQKVNLISVMVGDALYLNSQIELMAEQAPDESGRLKDRAASTVRDFLGSLRDTAVEYLMSAVAEHCVVSILANKGAPKVSPPTGMAPLPAAPQSINQIQPEPV